MQNKVIKIYLVSPRGFCAGVERAIDIVEKTILKLKKDFPQIVLSLDTRKSNVMKKGIESGVDIVNDVSGLNFDKKSFDIIKLNKIPFILHHMQGTPDTMQKNPKYDDALLDIYDFFEEKINFCIKKKLQKRIYNSGSRYWLWKES